jgi:hypothetical protein
MNAFSWPNAKKSSLRHQISASPVIVYCDFYSQVNSDH